MTLKPERSKSVPVARPINPRPHSPALSCFGQSAFATREPPPSSCFLSRNIEACHDAATARPTFSPWMMSRESLVPSLRTGRRIGGARRIDWDLAASSQREMLCASMFAAAPSSRRKYLYTALDFTELVFVSAIWRI